MNKYSKNAICSISTMLVFCGFISCAGNNGASDKVGEDTDAKALLQGVWNNEDGGNEAFTIKGDTVYYPDNTVLPVAFYVYGDSIIFENSSRMSYKIVKQSAHIFRFLNQNGEEIRLVKNEETTSDPILEDFTPSTENSSPQETNPVDEPVVDEPSTKEPVSEKTTFNEESIVGIADEVEEIVVNSLNTDTLINCDTRNYRCVIEVKPSGKNVVKTSINADGVGIDKLYSDNTVLLKVYTGQTLLLTKNFHKNDFAKYVSASEIKQCILSNIEYVSCDEKGVDCQALISKPDSPVSNLVNIHIPMKGGYQLSRP